MGGKATTTVFPPDREFLTVFLKDLACLLRKAPSGENHTLLVMFLKENGLQTVLSRRSSRPHGNQVGPDLFQSGEVTLERKGADKPAFLREFHARASYSGIAKSYSSFTTACRLARFYELNLKHLEHFEVAWSLLHTALDAFSEKPWPERILLKAYFLFAKHEGYPVKEEWLATLPMRERTSVTTVLQSPVDACEVDTSIIAGHIRSIEAYFLHHTDLILPDP